MFSIGFTDEPIEYPYDDTSIPAKAGLLVLGGWLEAFEANLSLWAESDYKSHWTHQLKLLVQGSPKVVLVVSYNDPKASSNLEIWRVYHDGELAHFQNQILRYSDLPEEVDVSNLAPHVEDRRVINEEGQRLSEWDVSLRDIELFLRRSAERWEHISLP